jgi:uncharacterized membrane protein
METNDNIIHIIATGTNQTFFAVVQYSFDGTNPGPSPFEPLVMIGIILLLAILVVILYVKIRRRPLHEKQSVESAAPKGKASYNPETLTERQNQILEIIKKAGGHTTQAKLQIETKIPKASLSRNIESLVRKKIVKKERKGMTMVIYFNDGE